LMVSTRHAFISAHATLAQAKPNQHVRLPPRMRRHCAWVQGCGPLGVVVSQARLHTVAVMHWIQESVHGNCGNCRSTVLELATNKMLML